MFNFKRNRWNKVNNSNAWEMLTTHKNPEFCGFSYFFHEDSHWTKIMSLMKDSDNEILKEKVRQGFSPTTMEIEIREDNLFLPKLSEQDVAKFKAEVKASKFGYIQALGYGPRVYRISLEGETLKVKTGSCS